MKIEFLRNKQKEEVRAIIEGFSLRYVKDLQDFATITKQCGIISSQSANDLSRLLRKWKACRPSSARKDILPLLTELNTDLTIISTIDLRNIRQASSNEREAIGRIWSTLINHICDKRKLTEVAPSKAILILTNGRLGPALDSNARTVLKLPRIWSSDEYLTLLLAISEDIAAFEKVNTPILLEELAPKEWQPVFVGRAYDMAVGPRE